MVLVRNPEALDFCGSSTVQRRVEEPEVEVPMTRIGGTSQLPAGSYNTLLFAPELGIPRKGIWCQPTAILE